MDGYGLGASLAATGVNALLGITGLNSQSDSNRLNQQNFREQMNFARYQYEDTKKYNSMQEQVKRMRAAGLNPALATSALGAGMQGSVSQPSANPQQPLDLGGLSSLGRNISLVGSELSQMREQTRNLEIQNQWEPENYESLISNREQDTQLKKMNWNQAKLDYNIALETKQERIRQIKLENDYLDAHAAVESLISEWYPQIQSQSLNESMARTFNAYASGRSDIKRAIAALREAWIHDAELQAKYGHSEEDWKEFRDASLDAMDALREYNESQTFHNMLTPWSWEAKALGTGLSHSTVNNWDSYYQIWRENLRNKRHRLRNKYHK